MSAVLFQMPKIHLALQRGKRAGRKQKCRVKCVCYVLGGHLTPKHIATQRHLTSKEECVACALNLSNDGLQSRGGDLRWEGRCDP